MEDRDILRVEMEERVYDDTHNLRLYSRHFDYRGSIAFTSREAPPAQPAVNMAMAAFGPLFQAYARMPFPKHIVQPLLQATMDQLLPELHRAIRRTLHPRIHMDRVEAAFRRARQVDNGSLVSLARGEVVPPRPEPEFFLDPEAFDPGFRRNSVRTATEIRERSRHALVFDDIVNQVPAREDLDAYLRRDMEQVLMYGTFTGRRSFDREAVERARETLIHCLNPVQRAEFERTNSFTVVAQDNRMYKVLPEDVYNVEDEYYRYCCVPAEPCPVYDKMLASKLWLEAQFTDFMATANKSPKRGRIPTGGPHPWMHFGFDMPIRNPAGIARIFGP